MQIIIPLRGEYIPMHALLNTCINTLPIENNFTIIAGDIGTGKTTSVIYTLYEKSKNTGRTYYLIDVKEYPLITLVEVKSNGLRLHMIKNNLESLIEKSERTGVLAVADLHYLYINKAEDKLIEIVKYIINAINKETLDSIIIEADNTYWDVAEELFNKYKDENLLRIFGLRYDSYLERIINKPMDLKYNIIKVEALPNVSLWDLARYLEKTYKIKNLTKKLNNFTEELVESYKQLLNNLDLLYYAGKPKEIIKLKELLSKKRENFEKVFHILGINYSNIIMKKEETSYFVAEGEKTYQRIYSRINIPIRHAIVFLLKYLYLEGAANYGRVLTFLMDEIKNYLKIGYINIEV